jgi:glycosyltransferase involved in cell wall biosynthesis
MSKLPTLYITYDGLLDPLGASQILPYLKGIRSAGYPITILSFEKPETVATGRDALSAQLSAAGISWKPLVFTRGAGPLGKAWDLGRMYVWATILACARRAKIVHARGHAQAQVGLFVKRTLGAKLLFDFRGMWVDERVDKGGWDLGKLLDRIQYAYFKRREKRLLAAADQIVVLTYAVVEEILKLGGGSRSKITVIPCCADFDHFPLATAQMRERGRSASGIPPEAFVLGHLGSVGRMYMLDYFFRLFEIAARKRSDVYAMVVSRDVESLDKIIRNCVEKSLRPRIRVRSASRNDVPETIAAMDALVSFIRPSYARMAASPTKLAECYAGGVPSICNAGVGDVVKQTASLQAGVIVDPHSDADLAALVNQLDEIARMGGNGLRNRARGQLGLEVALERYRSVYTRLT